MAVAARTEPSFSAGTPQVLFEGPYPLSSTYWSDYDVWPGGEEFLLIAAGAVTSPELQVVLNWTADVLQRLPGSE